MLKFSSQFGIKEKQQQRDANMLKLPSSAIAKSAKFHKKLLSHNGGAGYHPGHTSAFSTGQLNQNFSQAAKHQSRASYGGANASKSINCTPNSDINISTLPMTSSFKSPTVGKFSVRVPVEDRPCVPNKSHSKGASAHKQHPSHLASSQRNLSFKETP